MMLTLQDISYQHPDGTSQFDHLYLSIPHNGKTGLIGSNGSGKSTLLKLIAGELYPLSGIVTAGATPYYLPQILGQYDHMTIAAALRIDRKLVALSDILAGDASQVNLDTVGDDWTLEERALEALREWGLTGMKLSQPMGALSGGQKTKVLLSGITLHQADLILLDEPTSHLDTSGRQRLHELVTSPRGTFLVISHDIGLLNLMDTISELSPRGLASYGGNYDFYAGQKEIETNALDRDIRGKEKELRNARDMERDIVERQQKLDARGKKKQNKAGIARIMMNTLRNKAENSTSRIKDVHEDRIDRITEELGQLRSAMPDLDGMKLGFDDSELHQGKVLFRADHINYDYGLRRVWNHDLELQINSGERVAVRGPNGSGKTTLVRIILGDLVPTTGTVYRAVTRAVYVDQDYSLIDERLSVAEQIRKYNYSGLEDHDVNARLKRFLFAKGDWDKPCTVLSGGEKMRLTLCCLATGNQAPDILLLDEPTNNLDIRHMEILSAAVSGYRGTLIVVSHDDHFIAGSEISRTITLSGANT